MIANLFWITYALQNATTFSNKLLIVGFRLVICLYMVKCQLTTFCVYYSSLCVSKDAQYIVVPLKHSSVWPYYGGWFHSELGLCLLSWTSSGDKLIHLHFCHYCASFCSFLKCLWINFSDTLDYNFWLKSEIFVEFLCLGQAEICVFLNYWPKLFGLCWDWKKQTLTKICQAIPYWSKEQPVLGLILSISSSIFAEKYVPIWTTFSTLQSLPISYNFSRP